MLRARLQYREQQRIQVAFEQLGPHGHHRTSTPGPGLRDSPRPAYRSITILCDATYGGVVGTGAVVRLTEAAGLGRAIVGGKAAVLAELSAAGFAVPAGFVVTGAA